MTAFLRWWLTFCLTGAAAIISWHFDLFAKLYDADVSKLSFFILALFMGFTIYIGALTYHTWKGTPPSFKQLNTCWFFADSMTTLGMIGTVIGFLVMLGLAFVNLDVGDVASIQGAIKYMSLGMSTALVTTLVGMVSGWILKLQLVNLENGQA